MLKVKKYSGQKKNKNYKISRRQFLSLLSTVPVIGAILFASDSKKMDNPDELILVNGWVLKKKDLDAV